MRNRTYSLVMPNVTNAKASVVTILPWSIVTLKGVKIEQALRLNVNSNVRKIRDMIRAFPYGQ